MKAVAKALSSPRKWELEAFNGNDLAVFLRSCQGRFIAQISEETCLRSKEIDARTLSKNHALKGKKLGVLSSEWQFPLSIGRNIASPNQTCQGYIRSFSGSLEPCYDQKHCCERSFGTSYIFEKGKSTFH